MMHILQNIDSVIDNRAAIPETLNEKLQKILMVMPSSGSTSGRASNI
jgi:hypothetical protein